MEINRKMGGGLAVPELLIFRKMVGHFLVRACLVKLHSEKTHSVECLSNVKQNIKELIIIHTYATFLFLFKYSSHAFRVWIWMDFPFYLICKNLSGKGLSGHFVCGNAPYTNKCPCWRGNKRTRMVMGKEWWLLENRGYWNDTVNIRRNKLNLITLYCIII